MVFVNHLDTCPEIKIKDECIENNQTIRKYSNITGKRKVK